MAQRLPPIEIGYHVFLVGAEEESGAVRDIRPAERCIVVDIENAGDFEIPLDAIDSVVEQKVFLDPRRLDAKLRAAVKHAHDAEDYPPRDDTHAPPETGSA
jgi:hypothetical protein